MKPSRVAPDLLPTSPQSLAPSVQQAAWDLRLSHWSGALPALTIRFGWAYRRYQQVYGMLTYRESPVYGFRSTATGTPLDTFGRNVYLDTFDSDYGPGWRRVQEARRGSPTHPCG